jgi:hypothetical protein
LVGVDSYCRNCFQSVLYSMLCRSPVWAHFFLCGESADSQIRIGLGHRRATRINYDVSLGRAFIA